MKPRTILAAALAGGALTATASIPSAEAAKAKRCDQRGGTTLVATADRRVFVTRRAVKGDPDAATIRVFVCKPGSRVKPHRLELFHSNLDNLVFPETGLISADRWLLMEHGESSGVSDAQVLRLYDLKSGKRRSIYAQEGGEQIDFALTGTGAFAINDPDAGVTGFDKTGIHTFAPAGATDLAARGKHVYWTAGGVAASATLGDAPKGPINND